MLLHSSYFSSYYKVWGDSNCFLISVCILYYDASWQIFPCRDFLDLRPTRFLFSFENRW